MIGLPIFGGYELWRLRRWRLRFLALSNASQRFKHSDTELQILSDIIVFAKFTVM